MSFKNLKKNRSGSIEKLVQAAQSAGGTESKSLGDDRIWKLTRDKSDNGYAVLRFLPAPDGEDLPWVEYFDHAFKGPSGQWLIEKCPTSFKGECPVCKENNRLWNSGFDDDKTIVRQRKRRLHYVANVYVVSDPANPQNEGKVMLYQFGKKIFDKIMDVMQPQFQDEEPVNPFDFWGGADFKVKVRKVDGWINYDKSEFASQSEFMDGDEDALEEVYNKLHSLQDFVEPKNYKSFDELAARMNRVLGESAPMTTAESISLDESEDYTPPVAKKPYEKPVAAAAEPTSEEEDDTLSYFAKLAADS